jgi:hypothetical protein
VQDAIKTLSATAGDQTLRELRESGATLIDSGEVMSRISPVSVR